MAENLRIPPQGGNANPATQQTRTDQKPADAPASRTPTAEDAVDVSGTTSLLDQVRTEIAQTPEVDSERVASIKQRIADGDYPVDTARVAEKFLALEGMLND